MGISAIDLSDLNQLTQVFNAFLQAFLPIILIVAFIGFIVLLVGGSKLLGKFTNSFAHEGQIRKKSRSKQTLVKLATIAFFLTILLTSMGTSMGSMAIGGNLNIGTTQVFSQTPLTVTAENLDASTAYAVFYDGTAVINWTSAATPKDFTVTIEATGPATGNSVDVVLYSDTTTVETLTLYVAEASDFLPTGFIINLGVALMIIGIVTLVVIGIVRQRG